MLPARYHPAENADEGEDVQRHGRRDRDHRTEGRVQGFLQRVDREHAQGGAAEQHPLRELRGYQVTPRSGYAAHLITQYF